MDKIIINGLKIDTIIGVYDWERKKTQQVILNLVLKTTLQAAMDSDDVQDTIDYAAVVQRIEWLAQHHHPELLEHFADIILATIFKEFPVSEVQLQILKPDILSQVDSVGIEILRKKEDYPRSGEQQ